MQTLTLPRLTHFELAGLLGVNVSSIGHWLAGRRRPRAETVHLLTVLARLEREAPAVWEAIVSPHRRVLLPREKPAPPLGPPRVPVVYRAPRAVVKTELPSLESTWRIGSLGVLECDDGWCGKCPGCRYDAGDHSVLDDVK